MKMILIPFLSCVLCLPLLLGSISAYDCPWPECDFCLPARIREAPGVGFELTTSYGTSSTNHYNGSKLDVAHIPASPAYLDLLHRLSISSEVPHPSTLQRYLRRLNRHLGRPATKDVGIVSELLSSLRAVTEVRLEQTLDRVVVTTPQFPGLTREDLQDAVEYAGLRSWLEYCLPYPTMLHAPNAAYAANGHGLCKDRTNIYACLEEADDGDIPLEQVYAVSFTNAMLHTSVTRIDYAFRRDPDTHISAPDLGLSNLGSFPSPSIYWAEVSKHLQMLQYKANEKGRPISALVLLGENAGMAEFKQVLKDALGETWNQASEGGSGIQQRMQIEDVADPLWAAARGAALYARWRQEIPWNCEEPDTCKDGLIDVSRKESQSFLAEKKMELKR